MLKAATTKSPIVPCLTYRDAPAAIAFLCKAFGFEKKMVMPGENDTIAHAELVCGNAMIMVGSVKETRLRQIDEVAARCRWCDAKHLSCGRLMPMRITRKPRRQVPRSSSHW